ncbi:MAG: shikimate dehydrogenase [Lacibacter sp.]
MRQFGLIGYPLSHSFSKNFFTKKFSEENIHGCSYELFPISSIDDFPPLLEHEKNIEGLNVTIPYKEAVLPFLSEVTDAVREIGACNCIKIKNGSLKGYNTDVIGFEESLKPLLLPHHKKALILGTGGAAKAVAWVLKKLQIEFIYVSRREGGGIVKYDQINDEMIRNFHLIINTTPVGMQPNAGQKPSLPYGGLSKKHLCYDLVYNPLKTAFLEEAEKRGAVIKNGMEMLIIQAEESWKIWNS